MGDAQSHLAISCNQARFPMAGLECILLSYCLKDPYRNLQTIQADASAKGCSLKTDSGKYCSGNITQLTKYGEVELVPAWNLTPMH